MGVERVDELLDPGGRRQRGDGDDRRVGGAERRAARLVRSATARVATVPRSALVTTSTSGTSMIPALRNWSTSPDAGLDAPPRPCRRRRRPRSRTGRPRRSRSRPRRTRPTERARGRPGGGGEAAEAVAGGGRADEHARGPRDRRSIRARSPSSAPPERREVGSTASTATERPRARQSATSRESSDDLPTPGGPVTPDDVRRRLAAERGGGDRGQQRRGLLARLRRRGSRAGSAPPARRSGRARAGARRARGRRGAARVVKRRGASTPWRAATSATMSRIIRFRSQSLGV